MLGRRDNSAVGVGHFVLDGLDLRTALAEFADVCDEGRVGSDALELPSTSFAAAGVGERARVGGVVRRGGQAFELFIVQASHGAVRPPRR